MDLQSLLASIDAVQYLSQFVELSEQNGEWWGLSPFREEKTPSFSVRRETGSFYDFSSGIAGNCFTFTKYYYKCSAKEAVEKLKAYAGVQGELSQPAQKLAATIVCKKFTKPRQPKKESAATALPDDCMDKYEKRADKLQIWEQEGIARASLEKFQVRYDSFSDRIVYPIRNPDGKIVNIGGRTLDPRWKEKGLRKYTYFYAWGALSTIYGLAENLEHIQKKKEIILFEGAKSVLLADTWGVCNTGAILTSHLNQQQLKLLAKLGCAVVFGLDKDVRVRDDHNIKKLKSYVNVSYLYDGHDLLDAKDAPVDKGREVFQTLYEQRLRYR